MLAFVNSYCLCLVVQQSQKCNGGGETVVGVGPSPSLAFVLAQWVARFHTHLGKTSFPGSHLTPSHNYLQAISLMSSHGGTVECHCLMQVIRGAEASPPPLGDDAHNVLRQYRQQCSSTSSKAVSDSSGTDGSYPQFHFLAACDVDAL